MRGRRRGRRSGRFLVLGSASIDLLRQSGESLAGRIEYVELYPLDVLEIAPQDVPSSALWQRGGLPDSLLAASDADSLAFRQSFCSPGNGPARATGRLEWLEDERYNTAAGRISNADQRLGMVGDVLRQRTSAEWLAALEAEDVPCAPILNRNEVLTDPQVVRNELLREVDHPQVGRMRVPRPAAKFSGTPPAPVAASPVLGEGAEELLGGLGMSPAEVDELRRRKIVG